MIPEMDMLIAPTVQESVDVTAAANDLMFHALFDGVDTDEYENVEVEDAIPLPQVMDEPDWDDDTVIDLDDLLSH